MTGSWRPLNSIRGKAIGLAFHDNHVLVCEVLDDNGKLKGWCPVGGGIEFGETAVQALRREIKEELHSEIQILAPPRICENIFEHHGVIGHEIVFAFPIAFDNPEIYTKKRWQIFEPKYSLWVEWVDLEHFCSGKFKFLPEELLCKFEEWI